MLHTLIISLLICRYGPRSILLSTHSSELATAVREAHRSCVLTLRCEFSSYNQDELNLFFNLYLHTKGGACTEQDKPNQIVIGALVFKPSFPLGI